jgi:hypothetical protein
MSAIANPRNVLHMNLFKFVFATHCKLIFIEYCMKRSK